MTIIVAPEIDNEEQLAALSLISLLNSAANKGDCLQQILEILSSETQRILSGRGTAVYLLSQDKECLTTNSLNLSKRMRDKIEKLAGINLSEMKIRLKEDSIYRQVLESGKPFLTNSPHTIRKMMTEFTENRLVQKVVPNFYQMLSIRSMMMIPLISGQECVGLIETFRGRPFTQSDLVLFETISGQITLIIKRKRAEEALRESETRYRHLFEAMAQGVVYHDAQGKVISANPAALRTLGLPFEVLSRRSLLDSPWKGIREDGSDFPPAEHPALVALRTGQELKDVVLGSLNPVDRKFRWICINAVPLFESGDKKTPRQVFTTFDDITKYKEMEQKLRESERFNSSLLENSPHPVMVINSDNSIKYVNPAFVELTGYSAHEIVGRRPPFAYWPESERQQYSMDYASDKVSRCERVFQKRNGELFWVDLTAKPVFEAGKIKYYLVNWVDITERRLLHDQLKLLYEKEKTARQELEEEAKARAMFIDVLAHELRTPLTAMLPSASLLKEITPSETPSVQVRLIDLICGSAETMAQRLEELLDVARYSRGTFNLNIQPVNLKEFFPLVISRFKPSLGPIQHELITKLPENLPVVELDASRMEQVVINLLSNAGKYSHRGGKIYLNAVVTNSTLRVDVKDEGAGISPEDLKNLFKPYHRVEQDRKLPGLGLGLTICKQIVEAHGGKIRAESRMAKGSTFSFSVPVKVCEGRADPNY